MSAEYRIAVVGTDPFAESAAEAVREMKALTLTGLIEPGQPIPETTGLVFNLCDPPQRVAVVEAATRAGLPVITLPLAPGEAAHAALRSGSVAQVSWLRSFGALETLRTDVRQNAAGQNYGIFAAYRVRQGLDDLFNGVGLPMLHFVYDLLGTKPTRVQVTKRALFSSEPDAWFVLFRTPDDQLVTVEFAASLSKHAPAREQILVEVTGSDAVLRAEPTRQTVLIAGKDGVTTEQSWWPDPGAGWVVAAMNSLSPHDPAQETAFQELLDAVILSSDRGEPVELA